MSMCSPYRITLTADERAELTALARRSSAAFRLVLRARIVLAAAEGASNPAIAAAVGVHVDTARKWRRRFAEQGMAGLADADRSGRPRRFTAVQTAQVKALACELPARFGVPLSRWSADEVVGAGIVDDISASTVPGGWPLTRSDRGGTGPGSSRAIRTSPPRRGSCSTCMPGCGPVNRCRPATM
jgi:transposase